MVGGRSCALVCVLVLAPACSGPAPVRSPGPPDGASSLAPSVDASDAPSGSASLTTSPEATFDVAISDIPHEYTTPALEYTTDGHALIWSSGAPDGPGGPAPDLWTYVPGDDEPRRAFTNPRRDSALVSLAGDGRGSYAFIEQNRDAIPPAGWRLWYLPAGEEPMVVDIGDVDEGLLPAVALTPDRLVWTALHRQDNGGVESQLLMSSPPGSEPTTLLATDAVQTELLFPSLDGDRLVYSSVTVKPSGVGVETSVHLLDLSERDPEPTVLSGDEDAFMGVIRRDNVVWLRPRAGLSPLNGGSLRLYSLTQQSVEPVRLSPEAGTVNYHTVGDRFLVAETEELTRLYVYDLETRAVRLIEDLGQAPEGSRDAVNVRPRLRGDLLVYVRGSDDAAAELTLRWTRLPASAEAD